MMYVMIESDTGKVLGTRLNPDDFTDAVKEGRLIQAPDDVNVGDFFKNGEWTKTERPPPLPEPPNPMIMATMAFTTLAQAEMISDDYILKFATVFREWDEYFTGLRGTIVQENGILYRSIHDINDAGQNRRPSETPSMWTRIGNPYEEYPEWIQPIGAHDAYMAGARVTHNGKRWVNIHGDGNIWEPGVFGWELVEPKIAANKKKGYKK